MTKRDANLLHKTFWAGQLSARLEIVHLGDGVYQFEKTLGGQFHATKGTLKESLLRAQLAETELLTTGFEQQMPGYNGGPVATIN